MDENRLGEYLDVTSVKVRIGRAFLTIADLAAHFDHAFRLELRKEFGQFLILGVEHDLGLTFAIPKVEKEYASVVAQRIDPTDQGCGGSGVFRSKLIAMMASFHALNKKGDIILEWNDEGKRDEQTFFLWETFILAIALPGDME